MRSAIRAEYLEKRSPPQLPTLLAQQVDIGVEPASVSLELSFARSRLEISH